MPEAIKNAPNLLPGLELYYIAFNDLEASRDVGMGIGPLWWSTIQEWCEKNELDQEQTEACHIHLKQMDTAYIKYHNKKK